MIEIKKIVEIKDRKDAPPSPMKEIKKFLRNLATKELSFIFFIRLLIHNLMFINIISLPHPL
jgi:hypothetical protein